MLDLILNPNSWIVFLTLCFLEIVLGIDNIVVLSIVSSKLSQKKQFKARAIGLSIALILRIALLFSISLIISLTKPIIIVYTTYIQAQISWQSIIMLLGGIFLMYKGSKEIIECISNKNKPNSLIKKQGSMTNVIIQIIILDIIFSIDSVLTAIGLVNFKDFGYIGGMTIIIIAIIVTIVIMLKSSNYVSNFINNNPRIKILGLSFVFIIGIMLISEFAHLSNLNIFNNKIPEFPKGYIYFAIIFSLILEIINIRIEKKTK